MSIGRPAVDEFWNCEGTSQLNIAQFLPAAAAVSQTPVPSALWNLIMVVGISVGFSIYATCAQSDFSGSDLFNMASRSVSYVACQDLPMPAGNCPNFSVS